MEEEVESRRRAVVTDERDKSDSRRLREVAAGAAASCASSYPGPPGEAVGGTGKAFSGDEKLTGEIGEGCVVTAAGGSVSDAVNEARDRARCTPDCWDIMTLPWPTVILRFSEPIGEILGWCCFPVDAVVSIRANAELEDSSRRPERPRDISMGVPFGELVSSMATGIGISPRMRLSFFVFRSSFTFSLGSKPSVRGRGRTGCSCFGCNEAEKSGLRGELNTSRDGEGRAFRDPSLEGCDLDEYLARGRFRLSEKLLRLGLDGCIVGG